MYARPGSTVKLSDKTQYNLLVCVAGAKKEKHLVLTQQHSQTPWITTS